MNRIIKIFSLIIILFLVGCNEEKYVNCTIEIDNDTQNYEMMGTYKIYYDGSYVTKIEEEEKYISNDEYILNYIYESNDLIYYNLEDLYSGYDYIININDSSVNLNATIDMDIVDIKEMIKNNYLDRDYVVANKLTLSGAKYFYEAKGAKCDI